MTLDLLARVSEAALAALIESRRWSPGEVAMVIDAGAREGFAIVVQVSTFEQLAARGIGRSVNLAQWAEQVSDHAAGIPVLYSTAAATLHKALFAQGKVAHQ